MAKVEFEIPDDFIPMKGVAMLAGYNENGNAQIQACSLADTCDWDKAGLYREGLRVADAKMERVWGLSK